MSQNVTPFRRPERRAKQPLSLAAPISEAVLLGSLLKEPSLFPVVQEVGLVPNDFFREPGRRIFSALHDMISAGEVVTPALVCEKVGGEEALDYVKTLLGSPPAVMEEILAHARMIKQKSCLRSLRTVLNSLFSDDSGVEESIARIESLLRDYRVSRQSSDPKHAGHAIAQYLANYGQSVRAVPYGFRLLDIWTGGMRKGEYILLAGRPSMGKSSFALQVALNASLLGFKVLYFTLEDSEEGIAQRLLSHLSDVPGQDIRFQKADRELLEEAAACLYDVEFWIDDTGGWTPEGIDARTKTILKKTGLDLVIVDYINLISPEDSRVPRVEQIGKISRSLKMTAKDAGIPFLVLAQLSRDVENRQDKRPLLKDLRDSGALEQDADVVLFLYRPKYYKYYDKNAGDECEIIIAKQRNGPTGVVTLCFDAEHTRFLEPPEAGETGE